MDTPDQPSSAAPLHTPPSVRARTRYKDFRGSRVYHTGSPLYPSVTSILAVLAKPALVSWAGRVEREAAIAASLAIIDRYAGGGKPVPTGEAWVALLERELTHQLASRRELKAAGRLGTAVHERIEWELAQRLGYPVGPQPKLADEAEWAYLVWDEWQRSVQLEPLALEIVVQSQTHRYGGTIDLIARAGGRVAVIDFKTSKAVYLESRLQNVAYRAAAYEMGLTEEIADGLIVRLPKTIQDAEPEIVPVTDFQPLLDLFLAVRVVHERLTAWEAQHPS